MKGARSRAEQVFEKFGPDFSVGIEGGFQRVGDNVISFARVCIKSKNGSAGFGWTANFSVLKKVIELIEGV